MEALDILETCLYVHDLEAAHAFYRDVLGLTVLSRVPGRHVFFKLPGSVLLLFDPDASGTGGDLPPHGAPPGGHCCLRVGAGDLDAWRERLRGHGVEVLAEYDWPRGGQSLYFHDPSGNLLELAPASIWGLGKGRTED